MIAEIEKTRVAGTVKAIPSKSYAHRILICDFLAGKSLSASFNGFTSKDIEATERCLNAIKNGENLLDCGESGSTLRFLLPLAAAIGGKYKFVGHGKLMDRPNDELFAAMTEHGVTVKKADGIEIFGKLSSGEYKIRGDVSSQYVSGLLMALPYLSGDSRIILTTPLVSAPYTDITIEALKAFGIEIVREKNGFFIKGGQSYRGGAVAEGDWSNAAFFLVLGAICGEITVTGLNLNSVQGDKKIMEILNLAKADVVTDERGITVRKNKLSGFTFDAESCPDLVPIASVLAANAEGKTVIKNIERLKIKESDRIKSTTATLAAFGIRSECDGKNLTVYGGTATAGKVHSFNDHRIVMSAAVLAAVALGKSKIENAEAVDKSYPSFFADYRSVGGKAIEI